jgi:hypothetical protein
MSRSHDDQASAKSFTELFSCSGLTQEELAEKEGRSQAWVTFRLRFGRFLHFATMMGVRNDPLLANLTERRFRALWAQTDKNVRREELRFYQIIELLCSEHGVTSPIADEIAVARVCDTLDDEQLVALWRTRETCSDVARRVGVNRTWLRLQWRRLRYDGKIPKDGRRNVRVICDAANVAADNHFDGRPSLRNRDRLLRQLIAIHREPRFDLCTHNNSMRTRSYPSTKNPAPNLCLSE